MTFDRELDALASEELDEVLDEFEQAQRAAFRAGFKHGVKEGESMPMLVEEVKSRREAAEQRQTDDKHIAPLVQQETYSEVLSLISELGGDVSTDEPVVGTEEEIENETEGTGRSEIPYAELFPIAASAATLYVGYHIGIEVVGFWHGVAGIMALLFASIVGLLWVLSPLPSSSPIQKEEE